MLRSLSRINTRSWHETRHVRHMAAEAHKTLIVGAAGAVGKRLCAALLAKGMPVIASDRMPQLPGSLTRSLLDVPGSVAVGGVDVCDREALKALFREHADENTTVWNLAAPLSVETAMDPKVAEAVTVGGMGNVLDAMREVGARRICFTDSIGSFGMMAPRRGATARWLTENPHQDPGSDYGVQKKGCRDLMARFAKDHGGDPRFAVLPGVLHSEAVWGNGTTEYALDALLAAPHQATRHGLPIGASYVCPVDPDVRLPMIFVDDLMRGLIALQTADESLLTEPQHGYCIPGLSFTANELFAEIRQHHPGFGYRVELNQNMNKFANLWPDDLSTREPLRDLGYAPKVGLPEMVEKVLRSHEDMNMRTALAFKAMDADSSGTLSIEEVEKYVRRYLIRGREDYAQVLGGHVGPVTSRLMKDLDPRNSGVVSWATFSEWNRRNSVQNILDITIDSLQVPL